MRKYNTLTSKMVLEILYRVRICGVKKSTISKTVNQHRNTIIRVCNSYEDFSNEYINNLYELDKADKLSVEERDEIFCRHMKEKLRELDKIEIKKCCQKHLNCNLSALEYAKKLCENKKIPLEVVVDYSFDKENADMYLIDEIFSIRRRQAVPKNYEEVYGYYCETDRYKANPISLSVFKKHLKENEDELWRDKKWNPNLGKCIDTKK